MKQIVIAACALSLAAGAFAQGPGPGGKGQGWRFGASNTPGWALMSPEERVEHRNKMMEARAREQGKTVPATPRSNLCERMKQAGRLK